MGPQKIIMIGDFGKDLDDEHALVLAAGLQRMGLIELIAVVANLEPAAIRARLARGTISQLGLTRIPVGIGTPCFKGGTDLRHETDVPYLAPANAVFDGHRILVDRIGWEDDHSITLVLNSGLTDAAWLFMEAPDLFTQKIASVVIMGGVIPDGDCVALDESGFMQAWIGKNGAANNTFDEASALFLYRACQEYRVPLTVLMREAAYACQIPFAIYDRLVATGNPIGACLRDRQKPAMQALWQAANAPSGSPLRGKLPVSRDRAWFVQTFCDGTDPYIGNDGDIWPFMGRFQLYDPMNVVAAIPTLRERFYEPIEVVVKDTTHRVIGLTKARHGVKDVEGLRSFFIETEVVALEAGLTS